MPGVGTSGDAPRHSEPSPSVDQAHAEEGGLAPDQSSSRRRLQPGLSVPRDILLRNWTAFTRKEAQEPGPRPHPGLSVHVGASTLQSKG